MLIQIEWGVSLSLFSANCEELNSTKICLVGITNQFIMLKAILVWLNCVLPEAFLESVNIGIRTKKCSYKEMRLLDLIPLPHSVRLTWHHKMSSIQKLRIGPNLDAEKTQFLLFMSAQYTQYAQASCFVYLIMLGYLLDFKLPLLAVSGPNLLLFP